MHEAGRVCLTEILAHVKEDTAAVRLISTRPNNDTGMILVALQHRLCTVQYGAFPIVTVVGKGFVIGITRAVFHPCAVCFKIRLIDHVQPVKIAEAVKFTSIRIM